MNRNNFLKTILVAAMFAPIAISAQSDTTRVQCNGITKKNVTILADAIVDVL